MIPRRELPTLLALVTVSCTLFLGCTTISNPAMPLVRVEAEKDLQCAPEFVEVEPMLGGRYRAEGCGRVVIYNSVCEGLACEVAREGEEAPGWRDRPDPGSFDDRTR